MSSIVWHEQMWFPPPRRRASPNSPPWCKCVTLTQTKMLPGLRPPSKQRVRESRINTSTVTPLTEPIPLWSFPKMMQPAVPTAPSLFSYWIHNSYLGINISFNRNAICTYICWTLEGPAKYRECYLPDKLAESQYWVVEILWNASRWGRHHLFRLTRPDQYCSTITKRDSEG